MKSDQAISAIYGAAAITVSLAFMPIESPRSALTATFVHVSNQSPVVDSPIKRSRHGTNARSLLKHATGWAGNDMDEIIEIIKNSRSQMQF
jgi:hypothetical protein